MGKLNFAIIGCGRIAERHAEQINRLANLKAVCDIVESRASLLGQKYGSKVYTEYQDLLLKEKEIDVIAVVVLDELRRPDRADVLEQRRPNRLPVDEIA